MDNDTLQEASVDQLIDLKKTAQNVVLTAQAHRDEYGQDERQEIAGAVRSFVRELRVHAHHRETDTDRDYWGGVDFGTCSPPDANGDIAVRFVGLNSVADTDLPLISEVKRDAAGLGRGRTTEAVEWVPQTDLYVQAYYVAVEWMGKAGMLPGDGRDDWKIQV